MKTLQVVNHWYNDANTTEIVLLRPLDENRKLQNDLFWYDGDHMPHWPVGTTLCDEDVLQTKCYKQRTFQSIKHDIPNDCYMPLD